MRPGGEVHIADWGRPTGLLLRAAFITVQILDGFKNTRDNAAGRLVELFRVAHFADFSQTQTFSTAFGTLALYRGTKAHSH